MDPWFKFYAADYLLDEEVDMIPLEAQGILVRLWCLCWRSPVIPASPEILATRTKVDLRTMKKHWVCLQSFFVPVEGGLMSRRLEKERAESQAKSEAHRFGAQKTNEKRWAKRSLSDSPSEDIATVEIIAKRLAQRVAEVSPSESESESEKNNPLPPTGAGTPPANAGPEKAKRKPKWTKALPAEIVSAIKAIRSIPWPTPEQGDYQPDGKTLVPGVSWSEVGANLLEIQGQGADLSVCVAISERAVREWRGGKWIKAPQHFFGKSRDAPFRAYYQAHITNETVRKSALPLESAS